MKSTLEGKLLTVENAKTTKGEALGYLTGILYLTPLNENSRKVNLCPKASPGCAALCLFSAGRGRFDSVVEGRKRKTEWLLADRQAFLNQLRKDIRALIRKADREGLKPAVRLNGTSDLPFLPLTLAPEFPNVQFYDYTKLPIGPNDSRRKLPNYHLTFSRSELNETDCMKALQSGVNVAVPFYPAVPIGNWNGVPVIDGDTHDLRFLDSAKGAIVALKYKRVPGQKYPPHGFIVHNTEGLAAD